MFGAAIGGAMLEKAADHAYGAWSARYANRFSERMSSTSYQRAVKDMRAAGLNPILAATKGGASSPQGASPKGSFSNVTSTALQAKRMAAEVANIEKDTELKEVTRHMVGAQAAHIGQQWTNSTTQYRILEEQAKQAAFITKKIAVEAGVDASKFGEVMRYVDRVMSAISPFKSSAKTVPFTK